MMVFTIIGILCVGAFVVLLIAAAIIGPAMDEDFGNASAVEPSGASADKRVVETEAGE